MLRSLVLQGNVRHGVNFYTYKVNLFKGYWFFPSPSLCMQRLGGLYTSGSGKLSVCKMEPFLHPMQLTQLQQFIY